MYTAAEAWELCREILAQDVSPSVVSAWFDDTQAVDLTDHALLLCSPNGLKRDQILQRFLGRLEAALAQVIGKPLAVTVLSEFDLSKTEYRNTPIMAELESQAFTFDRFIVGNSNKFAHAAAQAVANSPGKNYNPLFIYGGTGLGKTHLIYSIAHEVRRAHPDYQFIYITAEDFANDLIAALREKRALEFHEKYRGIDMFLVDDVQFIGGKESTQEEFFHTFNSLYENKKQIVMTSDRPPREINLLQSRLKSRFEMGLLADIQPPDYETRLAIVQTKASQLGVRVPADAADHIATTITANVRQLEGTVKKLLARQELLGETINKDSAKRAIEDFFSEDQGAEPTPAKVIEETALYFRLDPRELRGQRRGREIVQARQLAMYLLRQLTGLSFPEIGREFEGRDHTTVIHSFNKIRSLSKTPEIESAIEEITERLK
jgi:chromosomal replication initiator protein